jgi:hypothetical protein
MVCETTIIDRSPLPDTPACHQKLKEPDHMEAAEIQAKATIAAALIACHAVEVPAISKRSGMGSSDSDAARLRDLTDYVYQALTAAKRWRLISGGRRQRARRRERKSLPKFTSDNAPYRTLIGAKVGAMASSVSLQNVVEADFPRIPPTLDSIMSNLKLQEWR